MNKKRIIHVLMLMFALVLFTSSCSKDEESNNNSYTNNEESNKSTPTNNDNYYVKYEVQNGEKIYNGEKTVRTITYKDVKKEVTVEVSSVPWEGTYGPFKKGDRVYMRLLSSGACNSIARLSVSKNREAFAIKGEFRYSTEGRLEYTIDY